MMRLFDSGFGSADRRGLRECQYMLCIVALSVVGFNDVSGQDSNKAGGVAETSRTPWTASRILGRPEPPLPYHVERVFSQQKFEFPTAIILFQARID